MLASIGQTQKKTEAGKPGQTSSGPVDQKKDTKQQITGCTSNEQRLQAMRKHTARDRV